MNVETIKLKNGKKYRATVYVNGRKCRSPLFQRRIDAQLWADKAEQGFAINEIPTFEKACLEWEECHCRLYCKPSTIMRNENILRDLLPPFGNKKLNQIQTKDIERHLRQLKDRGLSSSSLRMRVALVKSVYNWHMKRGVQVFNPTMAIRPLKGDEKPVEHWTREQSETFLAYTAKKYARQKPWAHLLYLVALNTGLRLGELLGLDWQQIDLERRQIIISQTYDLSTNCLRQSTKSGRIRYVGVNEALFEPLQEAKGELLNGLVFKVLQDQPLDRRNFMTRHFYPDMKAAGVTRIKFHSLRHTYATIYMSEGGNIFDLQKLLGHSTLAMTDRYAHFSPSHASQKANVVNLGRRFKVIEGGFGREEKSALG